MHDEDTPEPVKIALSDEQERLLAWALRYTADNTDANGFVVDGKRYAPTELIRIADQLGLPDDSLGASGERLARVARFELAGKEGLADILHTVAAAADSGYPLPYVTAAGEEMYADGEQLQHLGRRLGLKVIGDEPGYDDTTAPEQRSLSPDQVCMLTAVLERASQVTGDPELDWELKETLPDAFALTGPVEVRAIQETLGIVRAPVPKQEHDAHSDAVPGV